MGFIDVQLPELLSNGSVMGPGWNTSVQEMPGGGRAANQKWSQGRWQYDIAKALLSLEDTDREIEAIHDLVRFFNAVRGAANTWKLWDPIDHSTHEDGLTLTADGDSASAPLIAVGDAVEASFQMVKYYRFGSAYSSRTISLPKQGTVKVWLDGILQSEGADFTVSYTGGTVTFGTPPTAGQEIRCACHFFVHAAFEPETDQWLAVEGAYNTGAIGSILAKEVVSPTVWFDMPEAGGASDFTGSPLTADFQLEFSHGKYSQFVGQGGRVILPPKVQVPTTGGVIFILHCDSTSTSGIAIADGDSLSTLFSMPIGGTMFLMLAFESGGVKVWKAYE